MGLYARTISESSDDFVIQPLELKDLRRRREDSSSDDERMEAENGSSKRFFSSVMGIKKKRINLTNGNKPSLAKTAWKNAAKKVLALGDPWEKFHLDNLKTEEAIRHRYNALKQCWVEDHVFVKMEEEPFNNGAMRECFRMKKLSNFTKCGDWSRAHNYVAKRYMDLSVSKETYSNDVRLQMDAKLWGEEFNRHNPPKKVDIFQMAILEMINRDGSPYFHVEHFLDGKYVKYNSNSGFVRSEALRMTPQVFSHFSFERSGHELIVVDIQGVGDLYTDPQIHTAVGTDYGDGNLGTRGMALFFHSHICSSLCKSLGLTQFDLAPSELVAFNDILKAQKSCKTVVRGTEEHVILPTEEERGRIQDCIRLRSISSGYLSNDEKELIDSVDLINSVYTQGVNVIKDSFDDLSPPLVLDESIVDTFRRATRKIRKRNDSSTDYGENTETKENALKSFKEMVEKKARPSHVLGEEQHRLLVESLNKPENEIEHSILGQIHLDMAKYHELNRFVSDSESYNQEAAFFHVEYAAKCRNLAAICAIAQIHQGLPHDVLPDFEICEEDRDPNIAFKHMKMAAVAEDRAAMVKMAKILDTGSGLPPNQNINWEEAIFWYNKAVNTDTNDYEGNYDGTMDDPNYQLIARQAEMYHLGLSNLMKDANKAGDMFTEAADLATQAMKGKLASKYYIKAEEAWAEVE